MKEKYQIIIEKDENGYFIGEVVGLPACYTQAKTLPELLSRLTEVTEWSLNLMNDLSDYNALKKFNFAMEIEYA